MIICPRCKTIEPDGTETCTNCGWDLSMKDGTKVKSVPLSFAKPRHPLRGWTIAIILIWILFFIACLFSFGTLLSTFIIVSAIFLCFLIAWWTLPKIIVYALECYHNKI